MKRIFTDDERIRRVWDVLEIKNLMARHCYYHAFGLHREEMEELWVAPDSAYAATASFGQNWGFQLGYDVIWRNYVDENEKHLRDAVKRQQAWNPEIPDDLAYGMAGGAGMHTLTTPLIEIAGDGQTAQGMWYAPGQLTFNEFDESGALTESGCMWMFEKYAMDFVKVDGEWKIWHLFVGSDFACGVGEDFSAQPQFGVDGGPPDGEDADDGGGMHMEITYPITAYDCTYNWPDFPPVPKPYDTFADTVSYGPDGYPGLIKEGK